MDKQGDPFDQIADRLRNFAWFKFCRLELDITDEEIDMFVKGFVMEEELYRLIQSNWNKVQKYLPPYLRTRLAQIEEQLSRLTDSAIAEDRIERSDLGMTKKEVEAMLSTEVDYSTMEDSAKKNMIYGIIRVILARERRRFCEQQLGIRLKQNDFPIDEVLKKEMLLFWWQNKAERDSANLTSLMDRVEVFFKRNRGSERKRSNKNLFVNCKIKKMRLVTI